MRPTAIPPEKLAISVALRVNDACAFLGIGRSKIYQLIHEGKLVPHTPAGRVTFLRADLEALLRDHHPQRKNKKMFQFSGNKIGT